MLITCILLSFITVTLAGKTSEARSSIHDAGLNNKDCQIQCPPTSEHDRVILPAITQRQHESGEWENILECWSLNTTTSHMPDINNAFRLNWEGGFDAVYQYIFSGPSFMPAHPAPEPSLIIMSSGIGKLYSLRLVGIIISLTHSPNNTGDLRMPSGKCLRITAGDIFFSVGTYGRQTAWWSAGTVVSDLYFKDGKIPHHVVVPELNGDNVYSTQKMIEL